ncbi:MAG: methyltransferase domain-containing protein [Parcubacteria group bacterium]|jgi:SAM-dependent methyltransferase
MLERPEDGMTKRADMQFNTGSAEYARLAEVDPNKQHVQYPEALRLMGDLNEKTVLDIGCGNGTFTRMMAEQGAFVTAYDPSPEQIKAAKQAPGTDKLNINYHVADRPPIPKDQKFDIASAIMVLPLAADRKQLEEMFRYANESLWGNGKFVSMTLNPNFKRFGKMVHNRRLTKLDDGKKVRVEFFDSGGNVTLDVVENYFSQTEYEEALKNAGFGLYSWENLHVDPKGIEAKGADFWKDFEEDCPYVGLVAYMEKRRREFGGVNTATGLTGDYWNYFMGIADAMSAEWWNKYALENLKGLHTKKRKVVWKYAEKYPRALYDYSNIDEVAERRIKRLDEIADEINGLVEQQKYDRQKITQLTIEARGLIYGEKREGLKESIERYEKEFRVKFQKAKIDE